MAPNQIEELAPIAESLNSESNEINQTIAAFNAKLAALNVGLEVWLSPDEDHFQIGYAKVGEKWQLAIRYCEEIRWVADQSMVSLGFSEHDHGDWEPVRNTTYEVTALLEAPRQLRIRALSYMSELISHLKYAAEENLKAIRAAKKLAAEL